MHNTTDMCNKCCSYQMVQSLTTFAQLTMEW